MIVALGFAHVWGVIQLILLGSFARTVRVRTVLMALAVGLYACAPLAMVLQMAWTRPAAWLTDVSLATMVVTASYTGNPFIEEGFSEQAKSGMADANAPQQDVAKYEEERRAMQEAGRAERAASAHTDAADRTAEAARARAVVTEADTRDARAAADAAAAKAAAERAAAERAHKDNEWTRGKS